MAVATGIGHGEKKKLGRPKLPPGGKSSVVGGELIALGVFFYYFPWDF